MKIKIKEVMQANLDDIMSELYAKSMHQQAQISVLYGMTINLFRKCLGEDAANKMTDLYFKETERIFEDLVLKTPLKDEYLKYISNDFLKNIPGIQLPE